MKYVYIEAEYYKSLTHPMVKMSDSTASKGKYVYSNPDASSALKGKATYNFSITEPGSYTIFVLTKCSTSAQNTGYINIDGAVNQVIKSDVNKPWSWTKTIGSSYLRNGTHTLNLTTREHGLKYDMFLITNDLSFVPPLPTPTSTPSTQGKLNVKTLPLDFMVIVDGNNIKYAPCVYDLPQGTHTIKVEEGGYTTHNSTVYITANRTEYKTITLTKTSTPTPTPSSQGKLNIKTLPLNFKVVVDGNNIKTAPCVFTLPQGLHSIEVEHNGYTSYNSSINIPANRTTYRTITLTKLSTPTRTPVPTSTPSTCPKPVPNFTYTPTQPKDGTVVYFDGSKSTGGYGHSIISYEWYYDGVHMDFGKTVSKRMTKGKHTIILKVKNDCGKVEFIYKKITITDSSTPTPQIPTCPTPSASFEYSTIQQSNVGRTIRLNGSKSSGGLKHNIIEYKWYVDNVYRGYGITRNVIIDLNQHTVKLVIKNDCGKTDDQYKTITKISTPQPTPTPTPWPTRTPTPWPTPWPTPTPTPWPTRTPTPVPSNSYESWKNKKGNLRNNLPALLEIIDGYMNFKNLGFTVTLRNILNTIDGYLNL